MEGEKGNHCALLTVNTELLWFHLLVASLGVIMLASGRWGCVHRPAAVCCVCSCTAWLSSLPAVGIRAGKGEEDARAAMCGHGLPGEGGGVAIIGVLRCGTVRGHGVGNVGWGSERCCGSVVV